MGAKQRLFTIALAAMIICSLSFVGTGQVKAAGTVTHYNVGFIQTSFTVGLANNVIIVAADSSNNTVAATSATLTCSDSKAILGNPALDMTTGITSRQMYFGTAGTQTVTVTDTTDNSITGSITVTVAPIHFSISVTPTNITAGESVNVTVTALDASDNVLTELGNSGYGSSIVFSSTDSQAVFPLQGSPSCLVQGTRVFNITLNTPGSQTITATDQAFPLVNATTTTITVNAAATPTPTPTASPTSTATPTPTPTDQPTSTQTATPAAQTPVAQTATADYSLILIIAVIVIVVVVAALVAVLFLRKRAKASYVPPPPPPPP